MRNKWNALNNVKINHLEIGICPTCGIRLTSECAHRTDESEAWYAAQILAEQELYLEQMTPAWMIEAQAQADEAQDLFNTQEDARF